ILDMGRKAGKYLVKLPKKQQAAVEKICANYRRRLSKEPRTNRRAERMRQFEGVRNLHRLVLLSGFVLELAKHLAKQRGPVTVEDAILIGDAVFHELLLVTSFRRKNVLQLDLIHHIVPRPSGKGFSRIEIPDHDVKNKLGAIREIPPHLQDLI